MVQFQQMTGMKKVPLFTINLLVVVLVLMELVTLSFVMKIQLETSVQMGLMTTKMGWLTVRTRIMMETQIVQAMMMMEMV